MILWIILFLLIIAISAVLAYRSMMDFQEIPQKKEEEYGLYLVRRSIYLNGEVLDSIKKDAGNKIVSLERSFKNGKTVLLLFGPKIILEQYSKELNLLEMEDYTQDLENNNMDIWEIAVEDDIRPLGQILSSLPQLKNDDRFFCQTVLERNNVQIRAVLYSQDQDLRKKFEGVFIKVPSPLSYEQMLKLYCLRGISRNKFPLSSEEVLRFMKI